MRIGLIVPKYKQSGVARNRVKRQVRELARLHLLPSAIHVDVVIRVRAEAYLAPFETLTQEVLRVLAQLHQWDEGSRRMASTPTTDTP